MSWQNHFKVYLTIKSGDTEIKWAATAEIQRSSETDYKWEARFSMLDCYAYANTIKECKKLLIEAIREKI